MKLKVYLSGAITNNADYKKEFSRAAKYFRKSGYKVINPAGYRLHKKWQWEDYMKRDIKLLCKCNAVAMINEWKNSKGALLEHHIAEQLGLIVIYVYS